jgi:hypothetical protein
MPRGWRPRPRGGSRQRPTDTQGRAFPAVQPNSRAVRPNSRVQRNNSPTSIAGLLGNPGWLPEQPRVGRRQAPMRPVEPEPWALGVRLWDEPFDVHQLTVTAGSPADGRNYRRARGPAPARHGSALWSATVSSCPSREAPAPARRQRPRPGPFRPPAVRVTGAVATGIDIRALP